MYIEGAEDKLDCSCQNNPSRVAFFRILPVLCSIMKAIWQRRIQHRPSPSFRELGIRYPTELACSTGIHKTFYVSKTWYIQGLGRSGRRGRHVEVRLVDLNFGQRVRVFQYQVYMIKSWNL